MINELKQAKQSGFRKHFKYASNIFEMFQCIVFFIYFGVRLNDTNYVIPMIEYNQFKQKTMIWWVFIHSLQIMLIAIKVSQFMRVSQRFSKLVNMIMKVTDEVVPFTIYLLAWITMTSIMYIIAGIQIYDKGKFFRVNHLISTMI